MSFLYISSGEHIFVLLFIFNIYIIAVKYRCSVTNSFLLLFQTDVPSGIITVHNVFN